MSEIQESDRWIAVRYRAAGSPNVTWGPFDSLSDAVDWANSQSFHVVLIQLLDPNSPEETWWL